MVYLSMVSFPLLHRPLHPHFSHIVHSQTSSATLSSVSPLLLSSSEKAPVHRHQTAGFHLKSNRLCHVLLQANQVVYLAVDRRLGQTLVVSWKDAADKKESVARDALVIPSMTCFLLRRLSLPSAIRASFISL